MTEWWQGKFSPKDVGANEKHQTASTPDEKRKHPVPDRVTYNVPPEVANKIRGTDKKRRHTVDPHGTSTLAQPLLASVTCMDVGCWGGNAATDHDTATHWGKKRHFGVVFGRLSLLCEYRPWEPPTEEIPRIASDANPSEGDPKKIDEYQKVTPLLRALSTNAKLGHVVVRKLLLGSPSTAASPPEDRIHVILGDLHAPVLTERKRTYSGVPPRRTAWNRPSDPMAVQALPGAHMQMAQQIGVVSNVSAAQYPLRGRYDRGVVAPLLVPALARLLGEGAKLVVNHGTASTVIITTAAVPYTRLELAAPWFVPTPARVVFGATGVALGTIAAATRLRKWSDTDAVELPVVEDWFDRYHGTKKGLGADIFDGAGEDLLAWLRMLKVYQRGAGPRKAGVEKPPVRLMQLGDLFDFWIGLQCPFDLQSGARAFPDPPSARSFVKHWLTESLRNPAVEFLWNFDKKDPPVTDAGLNTVLLHGNHDTYMGTALLEGRPPLPSQFVEPGMGLVAQHGHQDDAFNNEPTAGIGYLLTQAVFVDNYVRTIEDPMSSLKTKLFGGLWTRLGYNEAALRTCLFERIDMGARFASTFLMGHTHEPALQRVDVVEVIPEKPAASPPPPQAMPVPTAQVCRPEAGNALRATVLFRQVHVLGGRSDEPWNIRAFIGPVSKKDSGATVTLFDEHDIPKRKTAQVVASPVTVDVPCSDQLEIVIQGWQGRREHRASDPFLAPLQEFWDYAMGRIGDLTPDFLKSKPDFDVLSVRVWPNTWDGTRTLQSEHLLVTLGIEWT